MKLPGTCPLKLNIEMFVFKSKDAANSRDVKSLYWSEFKLSILGFWVECSYFVSVCKYGWSLPK
jgi:hypothetical protein